MKNKIQKLNPIIIIILVISSVLLLIYSLGTINPNLFVSYFTYLYSSITLIICILNIKRLYMYVNKKMTNSKLYKRIHDKLYKHKYIKKYFEDLKFRNLINLCLTSIVDFSFIFIKLVDGIKNNSIWFISLSIYYFLMATIRLFLLNNLRKYNYQKEFLVYRNIGYFIMILNIALTIMIIQMVKRDVSIIPPGHIIYATALYSFYLIISAIINLIKYRKYKSPILSSIKVVNLLSASVSILMLQTTMIATFGENNFEYMKLMNSITGSFISIITLGISTYMIIKGQKSIKISK